MAELAETAPVRRASKNAGRTHARTAKTSLLPLADVAPAQWRALAEGAIEPNGYYLPDWELAVNATAHGRTDVAALDARNDATKLIGLVPVISMWRAYGIPLPALVSGIP